MNSKIVWTIIIVSILVISISRLLYVTGVNDFDMVLWMQSMF